MGKPRVPERVGHPGGEMDLFAAERPRLFLVV